MEGGKRLTFGNIVDSMDDFISVYLKKGRTSYIDLRDYIYIEPIGVVILKSIALDKRLDGEDLKYFRPKNDNAHKYLRILLENEYDSRKTYIPIEVVKNYEREKAKEEIVEKILEFGDFKNLEERDRKDLRDYISYMIGEVLDNAIFHSNSKVGAVVGGQYFSKQGKLQIVVADRGVGFLENIKRNYAVAIESDAIELALQKGVSSPPPTPYFSSSRHAGYGLFVLREIIKHTKGELLVISNNGAVRYDGSNDKLVKLSNISHFWKGSIVAFEFYEKYLNHSFQEFFDIYIRTEEQEEEEEFFF